MRLLLPDSRPADLYALGLERAGAEVVRQPEHLLAAQLLVGDADAALLPALAVLRATDDFTVVPAVALSAWDYPYARLLLKADLGHTVRRIAFDPRFAQEVMLARAVLREHYSFAPTFVPAPSPTREALADHDGVLLVGDHVPTLAHEGLSLDLGQEWYELSNYPFVIGLFATRHNEATVELLHLLREGARLAEALRPSWLQAHEMPPDLHAFYAESLRFRFDDLAMAGLTEFAELLFSQAVLDEIPIVPLATFPDDAFEEDDEDEPQL